MLHSVDEVDDTVLPTTSATPDDEVTVLPPKKKLKVMEFEGTYLRNIPSADAYEKSFMHRDVVTHVISTCTDFIISACCNGHIKFWKKQHNQGIEFVTHFRAHLVVHADVACDEPVLIIGKLVQIASNVNGMLLCSIADDKTAKVYDIISFDMINVMKLGFVPSVAEWIHCSSDPVATIAIAEHLTPKIYIFDGKGDATPLFVLDKLHMKPVVLLKFNPVFDAVISADEMGMVEYFGGSKFGYQFPTSVSWKYKTDTDLYEFCKVKAVPLSVAMAPNGRHFATFSTDKKIRVFRFDTAKMTKVIDESLQQFIEDKDKHGFSNVEFNRRVAVEEELDRNVDASRLANLIYDETGNFLIYATPVGIKIVNIKTNRLARRIGKQETLRFLCISLCRAVPGAVVTSAQAGATRTTEMEASDNPNQQRGEPDPILVCTAFKENRLFLFTNTEPLDMTTTIRDADAPEWQISTHGSASTSALKVGQDEPDFFLPVASARSPISFRIPSSPRNLSSASSSSSVSEAAFPDISVHCQKFMDLAAKVNKHLPDLGLEMATAAGGLERDAETFDKVAVKCRQSADDYKAKYRQAKKDAKTFEKLCLRLKRGAAYLQARSLLEALANMLAPEHVKLALERAERGLSKICFYVPEMRRDFPNVVANYSDMLNHLHECALFNEEYEKIVLAEKACNVADEACAEGSAGRTQESASEQKVGSLIRKILFDNNETNARTMYRHYCDHVHHMPIFGHTFYIIETDLFANEIEAIFNIIFAPKNYELDKIP